MNKAAVVTLILITSIASFLFISFDFNNPAEAINGKEDSLIYPGEKHFGNLRKLTSGKENAESYFFYDEKTCISNDKRPLLRPDLYDEY